MFSSTCPPGDKTHGIYVQLDPTGNHHGNQYNWHLKINSPQNQHHLPWDHYTFTKKMKRKRRTWRKIKRNSNDKLTCLCCFETSGTESRKAKRYFSKSMQESTETVNREMTTTPQYCNDLDVSALHMILYPGATFFKKLLKDAVFIHVIQWCINKALFFLPAFISYNWRCSCSSSFLEWAGFLPQTDLDCASLWSTLCLGFTGHIPLGTLCCRCKGFFQAQEQRQCFIFFFFSVLEISSGKPSVTELYP